MPIDYSNYPSDWKTKIRPDILTRANHCCEFCRVKNHEAVFRGKLAGIEVFQYADGKCYSYPNGNFQGTFFSEVEPLNNKKQTAIKIVLTIAHLDHDTRHNDYSNLKALCQKCHNRYDANHRKETRRKKKNQPSLF